MTLEENIRSLIRQSELFPKSSEASFVFRYSSGSLKV